MKFESKFGLCEIVYHTLDGRRGAKHDEFLEVVGVLFGKQGVTYACRYPLGLIGHFTECELDGDPDFNQNAGAYPDGYE